MRVNVIVEGHCYSDDSGLKVAQVGEQDLPELVAKHMIKSGKALEVEAEIEVETEKPKRTSKK